MFDTGSIVTKRSTAAGPNLVIIEQDMTASDVVRLASLFNGSISIGLPTLLMGPLLPTQLGVPVPASVSLDLSGCIGCVTLANSAAHVYLAHLHLMGLERPTAKFLSSNNGSSSSSSSNEDDLGFNLTLPLWAFQFNRSAGSRPRVTLRNVSLTLLREDFRLLLAGLSAGDAGLGGGWQFKVGGLLGMRFESEARRVYFRIPHTTCHDTCQHPSHTSGFT